jgi:hypothetical protein
MCDMVIKKKKGGVEYLQRRDFITLYVKASTVRWSKDGCYHGLFVHSLIKKVLHSLGDSPTLSILMSVSFCYVIPLSLCMISSFSGSKHTNSPSYL